MGSVSWRGGSREVVKPMVTARFKMEDACILCNVIENFWWKKMTKVERWRPFGPFELQMAFAQPCKNTLICLCKQPNTSIAKRRNWSVGCWLQYFFSLPSATSEVANLWIAQNQRSKSAYIGLAMTTLVKVWMSSLMSTMSTYRQKELIMVEGSAWNCFCPIGS